MGGRLIVATLLFGGTLLVALDEERGAASFTPRFLLLLIIGTYAASLVFALTLPRVRNLGRFAIVQLGWDLGLTTGLVYVAGGAGSGFTFLYGVTVLMGALVIGPRAAQVATVASLVLYVTVGLSLTNGWLEHAPDQPSDRYLLTPPDASFTMLVNILGLLLVALLAATLAGRLRLTGGRLREAAAQAAELARLNEDIVRSLSSGLITTDPSGQVRTVNPAALEIFHADRTQMVAHPIQEFFTSPEALFSRPTRAEGTGVRPDGSQFPIGFSKTQLADAAGRVTGELFLFQDLTELRELRLQAERAERLAALGRLAAALAHEVRNPLGSISGSVQLVSESTELEAEERRLLNIVLREVDRLDGLVNTMLQVGRPKDPQPARIDLVALTQDVLDVAQRNNRSQAVHIDLNHPPKAVEAWADSDQIRQVIWNLLNNALAHAPRGSTVRITVGAEGGHAVWSIQDEGPGIPAEAREHLFDMLYSKRPHGMGLGLALVDQLVRAHGGAIQVVSPPGKGAHFQLRLPNLSSAAPIPPPDTSEARQPNQWRSSDDATQTLDRASESSR